MPIKRQIRPSLASCLSTFAIVAAAACEAPPASVNETAAALEAVAPPSNVDIRRSLVVTELEIIKTFTFKRVMDQLVNQAKVPGMTSLKLFQQWWDTQNVKPGLGMGAHCNDQVDGAGNPILNAYPYKCRTTGTTGPSEGGEISVNPFLNPGTNPAEYVPIGLFNRFDLAPGDGSNCGEHRIVFARRSGMDPVGGVGSRNLVIFEFTMSNLKPDQGIKGCQNIVKFWADLSGISNAKARAKNLETFYFTGIDGHGPVVHVDNLGNNAQGVGQIRTNSLLGFDAAPREWIMREFKLVRSCGGASCLKVVPVTVKTNPFGPLFSSTIPHAQRTAFQADFVANQVARLATPTLAAIDMKVSNAFNTAQSISSGTLPIENDYVAHLGTDFVAAIQGKLNQLESNLTPQHIVARAQILSCAGCHRLNARPVTAGLPDPHPTNPPTGGSDVWPVSLGFVHVAENMTEVVGGSTRFLISPALANSLLPARKKIIDDFIDNKPLNVKDPKDPIGGRRVH